MTGGAPLRFSVVVPSLARPELERLAGALASQSLPRAAFEVIVVLDGGDLPVPAPANLAAVGARVERLPRRAGPGAARNRGAALARAPWLAFTEDDCAPEPDWLERAAERLEVEPELDVIEGATLRPGGRSVRRHAGEHPLYLPTNLFVRRAAFTEAGGYREDYADPERGVYFREDSDLGFTLESLGARVAIEPRCRVTHPDEHPRFLDPMRWARRYEMDPLLARRHPDRFRDRIESHRLGPFRLRRPIVRASLAYAAALLAAGVALAAGARGAAVLLAALAAAALVPIWAKWSFDPRRLPLVPIVPFALLAALLRGQRRAAAIARAKAD
jgi:glycosyltransferase involved in cell wall biosynthesis